MPYLKGGDLLEHVLMRGGGQRGVPEAEASALFRQMVQGVMHLHSRGIVHG
jgi:serine/threonine protein kinase